MTFREVLQIEIWSKRTTRKIWFVIGFAVLGLLAFLRLTSVWISPVERKLGRQALVSIEALQSGNGGPFEILDNRAKEEVEAAKQESLTQRDRQISFGLFFYLSEIELVRQERQRRDPSGKLFDKLAALEDHRIQEALRQSHDELGKNLHRSLD